MKMIPTKTFNVGGELFMTTATAVEVKETPIIFSGPMVRAILEGRKTQTRRVVKGLPDGITFASALPESDYQYRFTDCKSHVDLRCPYGRPQLPLEPPSSRLWVRETFVLEQSVDCNQPPFNDGRPVMHNNDMEREWDWLQPHYRATDPTPELSCSGEPHKCDGGEPCCHWRPSIFMPRWASRLTLGVTDIRVDRLQKISGFDARAEGYPDAMPDHTLMHDGGGKKTRQWFREVWDAINAKRGYSWDLNPWCWAITFQKL